MNGPGNGHYVTPAMVEQQAAVMREYWRRVGEKGAEASATRKDAGGASHKEAHFKAPSAPRYKRQE